MAKVFSHSVYKGSGSVGATYYRNSRGRSILCQKPGERPISFKGLITEERCVMACIGAFAAMHASSIINSFNRTKYGSNRNYFTKVNYAALKKAFMVELVPEMLLTKQMPLPDQIEMAVENYAVAHPNEIFRIKKAGHPIVMLEDGWDDADDPIAAPVVTSLEYVLDSEYRLKSITATGENLNQSIGFALKNPTSIEVIPLSGSAAIYAKGKSMVYTISGNVPVIGTKILQARYGQEILLSVEVEGDDREYVPVYVTINPANAGSVSGEGLYAVGQTATLTATPAAGKVFKNWKKDDDVVSVNISLSFQVEEETTLEAEFQADPADKVTLTYSAGEGLGLKLDDEDLDLAQESIQVTKGEHQIKAYTKEYGYVFYKWTDSVTDNPRTLNLEGDFTIRALSTGE